MNRTDPLRFRRRFAREARWWAQGGAYWHKRPSIHRRHVLALEMAYWCTREPRGRLAAMTGENL